MTACCLIFTAPLTVEHCYTPVYTIFTAWYSSLHLHLAFNCSCPSWKWTVGMTVQIANLWCDLKLGLFKYNLNTNIFGPNLTEIEMFVYHDSCLDKCPDKSSIHWLTFRSGNTCCLGCLIQVVTLILVHYAIRLSEKVNIMFLYTFYFLSKWTFCKQNYAVSAYSVPHSLVCVMISDAEINSSQLCSRRTVCTSGMLCGK